MGSLDGVPHALRLMSHPDPLEAASIFSRAYWDQEFKGVFPRDLILLCLALKGRCSHLTETHGKPLGLRLSSKTVGLETILNVLVAQNQAWASLPGNPPPVEPQMAMLSSETLADEVIDHLIAGGGGGGTLRVKLQNSQSTSQELWDLASDVASSLEEAAQPERGGRFELLGGGVVEFEAGVKGTACARFQARARTESSPTVYDVTVTLCSECDLYSLAEVSATRA